MIGEATHTVLPLAASYEKSLPALTASEQATAKNNNWATK